MAKKKFSNTSGEVTDAELKQLEEAKKRAKKTLEKYPVKKKTNALKP